MSFKEEKRKRDLFLFALYQEAKKEYPSSPEAVWFGFSKYISFSPSKGEVINNDEERGGYIIGERLGLSMEEVDAFLGRFQSDGHMSLGIGFQGGTITSAAIRYLERLELQPVLPVQFKTNNITVHNASGNVLVQNDVANSSQHYNVAYTKEDLQKAFGLILNDIKGLSDTIKEEFQSEMQYALLQMDKGRSADTQLKNIGALIKSQGPGFMQGLFASAAWEGLKHLLGIH